MPLKQEKTAKYIAGRIALYLGIAFVVLILVALLVTIQVRLGYTFSAGWLGLIGYTGMIFWVCAASFRKYWNRTNFWLVLVSLTLVHISIFILILHAYPQWRLIWYAPIAIFEAALIGAVLSKVFDSN